MVVNINGIKIQKYSHKKTAQLLSGFSFPFIEIIV
jgi:hypothetical protein